MTIAVSVSSRRAVAVPVEVGAGLAGFTTVERRDYAGPHRLRVSLLVRSPVPVP